MIVARLLYAAVALSLLGSIPRSGSVPARAEAATRVPAAHERSAKDTWTPRSEDAAPAQTK